MKILIDLYPAETMHRREELYKIYSEWLYRNINDFELRNFGVVSGVPYELWMDEQDAVAFRLTFAA